ncbi:hypothetical protein GCM10027295_14350 [Pseudaeromonas pectinilytica]
MKQQRYGRAIRLASTVGLSRDEWLDIRQQGIGSSDAAVAVGRIDEALKRSEGQIKEPLEHQSRFDGRVAVVKPSTSASMMDCWIACSSIQTVREPRCTKA